jgi:multiple sugar transport system substrate-binding protein
MKRRTSAAAVVALIVILAACGGDSGSEEATTTVGDTTAGTEAPATTSGDTAEEPTGDGVEIRWFVGLGAGAQPEQIAAQEAVVEEFNASQSEIVLVLETVENDVAYETLAT